MRPHDIGPADITEISQERSPCFGSCPVFLVRFLRDGHAFYDGRAFTKRDGLFTGTMPPGLFDRLAESVVRAGFFELRDLYVRTMTDVATVTTQVRTLDLVKTVENHGNPEPLALFRLEAAILRAVEKVVWVPEADVGPR